jgi:broad specificity phosphatase PhoE
MSSLHPRRVLYLARHGETAWNLEGRWQGHTDVALSDRGRAQAIALAGRLVGLGIAHVHASDLSRARETAEIVARHLALADVAVDPDLRERAFGVFEGLTREECAARHPDVWADYERDRRIHPPGAEPHESVLARVTGAMRRAAAQPHAPDTAVLVVSHGGSMRLLLSAVTGQPQPPIANGGLFRVVFDGEVFTDVENFGGLADEP